MNARPIPSRKGTYIRLTLKLVMSVKMSRMGLNVLRPVPLTAYRDSTSSPKLSSKVRGRLERLNIGAVLYMKENSLIPRANLSSSRHLEQSGLSCDFIPDLFLGKKRGRSSGWVEGARKLPRDNRESPSSVAYMKMTAIKSRHFCPRTLFSISQS